MPFSSITEELEIIKFKKNIEREMESFFEERNFALIEPKTFQSYDDFILSNVRQDSSRTVKVLGGNSKIFILRPDITMNILRGIFSKWDATEPLKVYYNSKIYRNSSGGRIQENYQMGIESLGEDRLKADRETIEMACTIMNTLGETYILEMGSSTFLDEFFREIELDFADESEVRDLIARKNRHALKDKLAALGLQNTVLDSIFALEGEMSEVLEKARSFAINDGMIKALDSLDKLLDSFTGQEFLDNIRLDLSLMPDLDYYDGVIFKGYCPSIPRKIISGGRYDRLTEKFGKKVPAIGFMVDMDLVTRIRIRGDKS
mgnify:CR=1 FL=1